jgi:hypothetical protein
MSTLWQKWGEVEDLTVGYRQEDKEYYIQDGESEIIVYPRELDNLIFQLMRLKRKVKND